jgi:two-component system, OmpR family, sensor histidine kinase CiaH
MFRRARLRLTLLYIALIGVTLALVAGGILVLGAQQARRTEDQSLRLRAEYVAGRPGRPDGHLPPPPSDAGDGGGDPARKPRLEEEGILVYELPVRGGRVLSAPPDQPIAGLPSVELAQAALDAGGGRFETLTLEAGEVRVYSLPVQRDGGPVAVVQVARSRYFVDATVTRLLLIVVGVGAVGLLFSAGTGFWLAGRTLRPIATALQRQRDFTADASHELRTPLALVRGNAELLQRHPEQPIGAYGDVVQDIVDEADRLSRLVSDLLTLARADSGHAQLVRRPVDLSALASQVLREAEPLAAAKGLAVRAEIVPGVAVAGDADRLRQLCLILIDNAVRYTTRGGVTLRVAREGQGALLAVVDTGPGIAAEHLPRLFDRFYRTDEARSAEAGGTGLGLAIARWIAEVHGGRISVVSTPGRGSAFTVHLPATTSRSSSVSSPESALASGDAIDGVGRRT